MASNDPYAGMQSSFAAQLHQLMSAVNQAGGSMTIASGYRDNAQQQQLYNNAVSRYGPAQAANWAAPPGQSNHEKGLAADIHGDARSMNLAHKLAPQFGLAFPLTNEAWHVQPADLGYHDNQGGPSAVTNNGQDTAMSRMSAIINALSGGSGGTLGDPSSYADPTNQTTSSGDMNSSSLGSSAYDAMFSSAAQKYGLNPALLKAVAKQESGYNPNARSGAGAQGIMQFMPGTAKSMGVNPMDPASAIDGAARMLSGLKKQFGSTQLALAAYNAGAGAVEKYGGIPPFAETQNYVRNIMGMTGRQA